MGGHGGLNILPEKSWHLYNLDNRAKIDEEKERRARVAFDERRGVQLLQLERTLQSLRRRRLEAAREEA